MFSTIRRWHRHIVVTIASPGIPPTPVLRCFRRTAGALLIAVAPALLWVTSAPATPINPYCPVQTDEPVDSSVTITYQGREIAFCCKKCRRQFLENPERYLPALVSAPSSPADHSQHDHSHDEPDGQTGDSAASGTSMLATDSISAQNPAAAHEHDHATDHNASNRVIGFLGKFHPVIVHFPIALIIAALVVSLLAMFGQSAIYDLVSIKMTYLGALSAVIAALLGLAAGSDAHYPDLLAGYFSCTDYWGLRPLCSPV